MRLEVIAEVGQACGRHEWSCTVAFMRDHEYFKNLEPHAIPGELAYYGVSATDPASCVATCGCCVDILLWSKIGDRAVWFEVWWLWFAQREIIEKLARLEE